MTPAEIADAAREALQPDPAARRALLDEDEARRVARAFAEDAARVVPLAGRAAPASGSV